jgi:hypothetical protein
MATNAARQQLADATQANAWLERPSPERLRELLDYDAETGVLTWRWRQDARPQWNGRFAGKRAGGLNRTSGYRQVVIDGHLYLEHCVIWALVTGAWPTEQIDHRYGNRANNKFRELREATHAQNSWNSRRRSDNTSGIKGVSWYARHSKWQAQIRTNYHYQHLGYFTSKVEAAAAYANAAQQAFGEFARIV